jgi:putative addiction module component (TIGR02574 family)
MSLAPFDISKLTPDERLQLIGELWDSLTPDQLPIHPELAAELERRRALLRQDPSRGRPWREALTDIERRRQ